MVQAAREVIETGTPRLLRFAVSDELAWGVGLACGGALSVFVERGDRELLTQVREGMRRRLPVALAVVTSGANLGESLALAPGLRRAPGLPNSSRRPRRHSPRDGRSRPKPVAVPVFCDVILPLRVVGDRRGRPHRAGAVRSRGARVGYRPVICDPRPVFASAERFPGVEIVNDWPEEGFRRIGLDASTAVATLTHDPKLDDPALALALESPAFYVGALGSRKTQERRLGRLRERGVSEAALSRIAAPIGLPIGARSPDQIALAVMAEVVAARNGVRGIRAG